MQQIFVNPNQIIGMNDYPPLHSPEALAGYYAKFKNKLFDEVAPVPLIHKSVAILYFMGCDNRFITYNQNLERFFFENSEAEYFMLDGKHRSTAAVLAGESIPCVIIWDEDDVNKIHDLIISGKIPRLTGVEETLDATLETLEEHFFLYKRFWTVEEKTKAMIENGDIAANMLEAYPFSK